MWRGCRTTGPAPRAQPRGSRQRLGSAAGGRRARLRCSCAAAPDGGASSSRFSAIDHLKKAILGSPPAQQDPSTPTGAQGKDAGGSAAAPCAGAATSALASAAAPAGREPLAPGSWDWWNAYFDSMDDAVRELDGVYDAMDEAVAAEDYAAAAALRRQREALEDGDVVGWVLREMQAALEEERYGDAAALRDGGGAGVLGWWAGRGEGDDAGHLLRVTADFGRYVAHAYTGANIAELMGWSDESHGVRVLPTLSLSGEDSGPVDNGTAVFELFVREDPTAAEQACPGAGAKRPRAFLQQAAALHAPYSPSTLTPAGVMDDLSVLLASEVGGGTVVSVERGRSEDGVDFVRINHIGNQAGSAGGDGGEGSTAAADDDDDDDDGIRTIDDLAASIFGDKGAAGAADESSSGEEQGNTEDSGPDGRRGTVEARQQQRGADGEAVVEIECSVEGAPLGGHRADVSGDDDNDAADPSGHTLASLGFGVLAHRVPATIGWLNRDAFVLEVPEAERPAAPEGSEAGQGADSDSGEQAGARLVDLTKGSSRSSGSSSSSASREDGDVELSRARPRPDGIDGKPGRGGRRGAGGSIGVDEIEQVVRKAMGEAIAQGIGAVGPGRSDPAVLGLKGRVNYRRLAPNDSPTHPFSGVYLGTFGPHGPELLQVSRVEADGEEWVQGTKLTGDPHVPAGKVSFRARVSKSDRLPPSAAYPPEFGVQQRYRGQGRVAREGFSHAKWVDGELLTFSAANPLTRGAELGFVYDMGSDQRFLLLFTKVDLSRVIPLEEGEEEERGGSSYQGPGRWS